MWGGEKENTTPSRTLLVTGIIPNLAIVLERPDAMVFVKIQQARLPASIMQRVSMQQHI